MRQDGRYSSRGSRDALFIEFANSSVENFSTSLTFILLKRSAEQTFPPLSRFISLHQALAFFFFFFFGFARLSFSVNLIPIQFILY